MRAVVLREFGPPENLVVEDVPEPVPGPGQVVLEVEAVGVPFIETQVRAGAGPNAAHRPDLPVVLGNGVGGVVLEAGPRVDSGLVGRRVVSTTGGRGGYAERVAVDATEPIEIPDGVELRQAVALLADGRTAVALTQAAAPAEGDWVLVEAAGGGLGNLLVQLATSAGARVIGAASNARKRGLAASAGAELTVDYTEPGWVGQVLEATGGVGVDVAYDGVGGEIGAATAGVVLDGGRLVPHGMAGGPMVTISEEEEVKRRELRVVGLGSLGSTPDRVRAWAREALRLAASGRLRQTVGQVFPLEQAAAAHAAIEARRTVGKTLLIP